jgi:GT2 family glycosyltransferase
MTPAVSIIVVNFNGGEKLAVCIAALVETANGSEIVVIDNASTDGSADLPEHLAGHVRIIRNAENLGYAAALNQGARVTRGQYLVFSNMDTLPEPGWLDPLVAQLRDRRDAGAVNPLLLLSDGRHVNAAGQNIHVTGLGFNRGLGDSLSQYGDRPFEVAGIQGASFAMRRSVYEEIRGFDATGFLYHEDVNLSWLLRLAGYNLYCVPASRVRHDYFLSMYAHKFHLLERNRLAMLLAYMRPSTRVLIAPLLLLTEALAWGYAILRRHGFPSAKWRSYQWVAAHRPDIEARRQLADGLRRVGDLPLLRRFRWEYDWSQFGTLARERGQGQRRPAGLHPPDVPRR